MRAWEHKLQVWNLNQIWCAVEDAVWQKFRLSLKGIFTEEKLDRLDTYLRAACKNNSCTVDELHLREWKEKCRVDNYIMQSNVVGN